MTNCKKCKALLDEPKKKQHHCEKCCATVGVGSFPFCKGNPGDHGTMYGFDEAFEPYVDTQLLAREDPRVQDTNNMGIPGVMINSRSERRALMKQQGLQYGSQKFENRGKTLYFQT
jgi:hypothetical protein